MSAEFTLRKISREGDIMLNPAISEEYGGDVEIILNELVNRLGKELAYTCYVIPGSIKVINGTHIPHFIVTTSDKLDEIRSVVSAFEWSYGHGGARNLFYVFQDSPSEVDIKLCM